MFVTDSQQHGCLSALRRPSQGGDRRTGIGYILESRPCIARVAHPQPVLAVRHGIVEGHHEEIRLTKAAFKIQRGRTHSYPGKTIRAVKEITMETDIAHVTE